MSKNVLYCNFNDERSFVVEYLEKTYGWNPIFFMGEKRSHFWLQENYPKCLFREEMVIRQGSFDYSGLEPSCPIDSEVIGAFSKYELSCLSLLEDTTGWNFSYEERRRYYFDILKFWNNLIQKLKPEIYFSWTRPHTIADYTLYLLCKYYYSIPTLYIEPFSHFNNYNLIGVCVEDMASPIMDIYNSKKKYSLHPEVRLFLSKLKSRKPKAPAHILEANKRLSKKECFQIGEFVRLIGATFITGKGFRKVPIAFKKNKKRFENSDSRLNYFEYFWFKEKLRVQNKKLGKIYAKYCAEPKLNEKYIYFAACYQPEATNCPNAGVYEDIILVLDLLSSCLPVGWKIYYKEHPSSFFGGMQGSLRRSLDFYRKVNSYPNIKIISTEEDTFDLIDHSQAVASLAGTVNWEAAVRGKPSLCFGSVWYQGCKSIFKINTYQDCIDALEKIKEGYTPNQDDIERYAAAIHEVSIKGIIHRNFYETIKNCDNPQFEMERIAKVFYKAYLNFYEDNESVDSEI